MNFIVRFTLWLVNRLLNMVDMQHKKAWLSQFINTNDLIDESLTAYYFQSNLNANRFDNRDIQGGLDLARRRSQGAPIYYITDRYPLPTGNLDITEIAPSEVDDLPNDGNLKVFICVYESDERMVATVKRIIRIPNAVFFAPPKFLPTARYFHRNDIARKVLVRESRIDMKKFEVADFENIIQAIDLTRDIEGDFLEIGVYQGRSSHMALAYMRESKIDRCAYFIDVFEGFTYEAAHVSSDALWDNTHVDTSLEKVQTFLREFDNAKVLKLNVIDDGFPDAIRKVAVCNLDVDMYEAVLKGLEKVAPLISHNGIIIAEDAGHTPALAGAYVAVCEFLESETGKAFLPIHMSSGQMLLIKMR